MLPRHPRSSGARRRLAAALAVSWSLVLSIQARDWSPSPASAPACEGRGDLELGCRSTSFAGYGSAPTWADEVQMAFVMPAPPHGGPWLLEYVGFFLSGSGTHHVILRAVGPGGAPGAVVDASREFTPACANWPPDGWTYVDVHAGLPHDEYLQYQGGDMLMVGTELRAADAIGLDFSAAPGHAWGAYEGTWVDDAGITVGIRVGLADLGLSQTQQSTWGQLKDLFK